MHKIPKNLLSFAYEKNEEVYICQQYNPTTTVTKGSSWWPSLFQLYWTTVGSQTFLTCGGSNHSRLQNGDWMIRHLSQKDKSKIPNIFSGDCSIFSDVKVLSNSSFGNFYKRIQLPALHPARLQQIPESLRKDVYVFRDRYFVAERFRKMAIGAGGFAATTYFTIVVNITQGNETGCFLRSMKFNGENLIPLNQGDWMVRELLPDYTNPSQCISFVESVRQFEKKYKKAFVNTILNQQSGLNNMASLNDTQPPTDGMRSSVITGWSGSQLIDTQTTDQPKSHPKEAKLFIKEGDDGIKAVSLAEAAMYLRCQINDKEDIAKLEKLDKELAKMWYNEILNTLCNTSEESLSKPSTSIDEVKPLPPPGKLHPFNIYDPVITKQEYYYVQQLLGSDPSKGILKVMDAPPHTWLWARYKIIRGYRVKLPEWTGYWYANEKVTRILVLTKKGDILVTPSIEKNKNRTDWQIVTEQLGFDFAINALKNGRKVFLNQPYWKLQYEYLQYNTVLHTIEAIIIRGNNIVSVTWPPTLTDLLTVGWELYDKSRIQLEVQQKHELDKNGVL